MLLKLMLAEENKSRICSSEVGAAVRLQEGKRGVESGLGRELEEAQMVFLCLVDGLKIGRKEVLVDYVWAEFWVNE